MQTSHTAKMKANIKTNKKHVVCPRLNNTCTAQRMAVLPEPAARNRRGEGVERAQCGSGQITLRALAAGKLAACMRSCCCIAEAKAVIQATFSIGERTAYALLQC